MIAWSRLNSRAGCIETIHAPLPCTAVTLGLAVNRRFPWTYVPAYMLAQFAGAVAAAAAAWALYGQRARTAAYLGATYPAAGVGVGRVLGAEAVVTFLLVLVIIAVAAMTGSPRSRREWPSEPRWAPRSSSEAPSAAPA